MKYVQKYYQSIKILSRRRWVWVVLFALVLLFNVVIFPLLMSPGEVKPLDTRLHYTSGDVFNYLSQMNGPAKTRSLLFHTTADLLYPFIYTLFLSVLLYLAGGRYNQLFVLIPLSILFFDLLENLSIVLLLTVLQSGGLLYRAALVSTPVFTTAKWICTGVTACTLFFAFSAKGIRHFTLK